MVTANGQADCASPSTRSASPACPADVTSSRPNQASRTRRTTVTRTDTSGRSGHGAAGPEREAAAGHTARAVSPTTAHRT